MAKRRPTSPSPEGWITEPEAAAALGRKPATLKAWRLTRGAPHRAIQRPGGRRPSAQYKLSELRAWARKEGLLEQRGRNGSKRSDKPAPAPPAQPRRPGRAAAPAKGDATDAAVTTGSTGRTVAELERVLAVGGEITEGERQRIDDLYRLRRARHESSKRKKRAVEASRAAREVVNTSDMRSIIARSVEWLRLRFDAGVVEYGAEMHDYLTEALEGFEAALERDFAALEAREA